MSARLAIGAVGALAGLAALGSRRGSRQRRVGWSIDHVADLSAYASWRQIVDEGVVLVAGYASYAGGIREFEIAADDWGLEQFREFASTWIWDEIHAGGTEASYLARLQGQLEDFRAWLEALRYPLTVYRGIRLGAHDDLQLGVDDDAEVYHDHWSTSLPVARGSPRAPTVTHHQAGLGWCSPEWWSSPMWETLATPSGTSCASLRDSMPPDPMTRSRCVGSGRLGP